MVQYTVLEKHLDSRISACTVYIVSDFIGLPISAFFNIGLKKTILVSRYCTLTHIVGVSKIKIYMYLQHVQRNDNYYMDIIDAYLAWYLIY